MCSLEAEKTCEVMFGARALFVPYTDPGYILFKVVAEGISRYTEKYGFEPTIIFLENHGVFVASDTTEEIETIYAEIMTTIEGRLSLQLPGTETTALKSEVIEYVERLHPGFAGYKALGIKSELTDLYVMDETSFSKANKSFTPDDIVYCKAHYLYIPAQVNLSELLAKTIEMIADYFDKYGYLPKVLALQNQGIVAIEENLKSARNVLDVYENILKISFFSENFGGPKFMNDKQIAFIDNWEVENYRRKIAKS